MHGGTEERTDGRTDKSSYKDATTHPKSETKRRKRQKKVAERKEIQKKQEKETEISKRRRKSGVFFKERRFFFLKHASDTARCVTDLRRHTDTAAFEDRL